MSSFWSFPKVPEGLQGKGALLIVPLIFGAFVLYSLARFVFH
jgi:hypothetical protein